MEAFFIAIGILCGICGLLSLVLVIADRYLNDYGDCTITVNDGEKEMVVRGGDTILGTLSAEGLFIPSACGGRGSCGMCKLVVTDGAPPLLPTEEPHLDKQERADNVRLCCQLKVREDMKIEVPSELFNIKEYNAKVEKLIDLNHDIKLLRMKLPAGETINLIPGQYVQLKAPKYKGNKEEVYRAYSVASDPTDNTIVDLCIRLVPGGICTTYVFDHLQEGDDVVFNGPYGDFRLTETDKPMIFIAGGSGMAPFLSILAQIRNENIDREVYYYFGARSRRDLICLEEMAKFEKEIPKFKFFPCLSEALPEDNWDGEEGLVTEVVYRHFEDLSNFEGYLCGSPGMCDASVAALTKRGMAEEHVYFDKFA